MSVAISSYVHAGCGYSWHFDGEVSAGYFALLPNTTSVRQEQVDDRTILDFDSAGSLIGIELLGLNDHTLPWSRIVDALLWCISNA